jgi:hypothetical protein
VILSNEVECDEAYVVAGHKGQPEVVKSKERKGRRRRRKSKAGRGTMEKEKPPVFGMISPPYTFFLLNGDMKLNRNRQFLVQKMLKKSQS